LLHDYFGPGTQLYKATSSSPEVDVLASATKPLRGYHVVNVGTGRETSLLELRAAIEEIMDRPLRHVFAPPRPGDVGRSCANVTALHNLLGLTCTTSLADGLATLLTHSAQEFRTETLMRAMMLSNIRVRCRVSRLHPHG
jgi:nucleoside-diphosphate-sugar epimerase